MKKNNRKVQVAAVAVAIIEHLDRRKDYYKSIGR